ncbi:hypothetical protein [Wolbachia pipientis]
MRSQCLGTGMTRIGHWDDKNRALGSSGLKLQCLYSCDLYSIAE